MELASNFEEEKVELWLRRDPASFLLQDLQIAVKNVQKRHKKNQVAAFLLTTALLTLFRTLAAPL